ncbi:hypothetical protein CapIbe_008303 [Capra ibex]
MQQEAGRPQKEICNTALWTLTRLKEPRGPHDSKVDSSFRGQELQASELSGEIHSWHHDHIPLLKFLFARRVACVVFSSSRNVRFACVAETGLRMTFTMMTCLEVRWWEKGYPPLTPDATLKSRDQRNLGHHSIQSPHFKDEETESPEYEGLSALEAIVLASQESTFQTRAPVLLDHR